MADSPSQVEFMEGSALAYRATVYEYSGVAAGVVQALKYERCTSVSKWMCEQLRSAADRLEIEFDVAVPVPIHWSRRARRGFNQAEIIAQGLRPRVDLLARTRATRPQVGLSREDRATNLVGAFEASPRARDLRLLLVDDVLTSGYTARECAKALAAAGAREVGILAFAGENDDPRAIRVVEG